MGSQWQQKVEKRRQDRRQREKDREKQGLNVSQHGMMCLYAGGGEGEGMLIIG